MPPINDANNTCTRQLQRHMFELELSHIPNQLDLTSSGQLENAPVYRANIAPLDFTPLLTVEPKNLSFCSDEEPSFRNTLY
jgi:hypothetical protein